MKQGLFSVLLCPEGENLKETGREYIVGTMFVCNFIGIAFCRSLHYQFYCWYWHALPYLLWQNASLPVAVRLLIVGSLEWTWDCNFPATPLSSAVLHSPCFASYPYEITSVRYRERQKKRVIYCSVSLWTDGIILYYILN